MKRIILLLFLVSLVHATFPDSPKSGKETDKMKKQYALIDKVQEIVLNKNEQKTLNRGEIVLREIPQESSAGKTFEAIMIMDASIENLYTILRDYEKYPEFMPDLDDLKIKEKTEKFVIADYTLGLPLGNIKKYRLKLWSEIKEDTAFKLAWKKLPWKELKSSQTIVDTQGYWIVKKDPSKEEKLLVLYHVYTDPGHIPFGLGWIVNILTKKSLPQVLKATQKRVLSLYKMN